VPDTTISEKAFAHAVTIASAAVSSGKMNKNLYESQWDDFKRSRENRGIAINEVIDLIDLLHKALVRKMKQVD